MHHHLVPPAAAGWPTDRALIWCVPLACPLLFRRSLCPHWQGMAPWTSPADLCQRQISDPCLLPSLLSSCHCPMGDRRFGQGDWPMACPLGDRADHEFSAEGAGRIPATDSQNRAFLASSKSHTSLEIRLEKSLMREVRFCLRVRVGLCCGCRCGCKGGAGVD